MIRSSADTAASHDGYCGPVADARAWLLHAIVECANCHPGEYERKREFLEQVDSALVRYEKALQPAWQPIATAPKDGTWFLAWDYDGGSYVYRMGPGFFTGEDPHPTHWMPLPAPPRAGTEDELSRASATTSASAAQK